MELARAQVLAVIEERAGPFADADLAALFCAFSPDEVEPDPPDDAAGP
ncbi:hypothetical protein [Streptomyces sp. NPDC088115]